MRNFSLVDPQQCCFDDNIENGKDNIFSRTFFVGFSKCLNENFGGRVDVKHTSSHRLQDNLIILNSKPEVGRSSGARGQNTCQIIVNRNGMPSRIGVEGNSSASSHPPTHQIHQCARAESELIHRVPRIIK